MKYKTCIIIMVMAIFLFAIASVSAGDVNETTVASENDLEIDQAIDDVISAVEDTDLASSGENEILGEGELSFTKLNETINGNTDNTIYLNGNYKYSDSDDSFKKGIVIDRDVNIYGNGSIIDGNNEARIFQINGGNVVFYNITFVNGNAGNTIWDKGGAINGNCKAINCTFQENQADDGGAMYRGSAVDCTFFRNDARDSGGAMYGGSAVNCTFSGNDGDIGGAMYGGSAVNCTFSGNLARSYGGAMYRGSAVNCTFSGNDALYGGAIYDGSAVNCNFTGNKAYESSGAMYEGSAVNCTFNSNTDPEGYAMREGYYKNWFGGDKYYESYELSLSFDMGNFISTYDSNWGLRIKLVNQNWDEVGFIDVEVIIYNKNDTEILRKPGLSGFNFNFDLAAGNYAAQLIVTYPGLTVDSQNITLTINKATPKIEVQAYDTTYPGDVVVNVKSDVDGVYVVRMGDKSQSVTLNEGVGKNISFTGLAANEQGYKVNVSCNATENYTAAVNDTVKVIVHKATPKIEVQAYDMTYPGDVVVNVKSDVDGVYVVKIGDKSQSVVLNEGVGKNISFTGLAANEQGYKVNVSYGATENYTAAVNDTVKVIVHKATPKIEVQAYDTTYPGDVVVNVKSDVDGVYVVKIGDKSQSVTLNAGVGKNISFTGLTANEQGYKVNVSYDVTENYTAGVNDTIVVKIRKASVKISSQDITATYNIDRVMVVTLTDSNGNPIGGVSISVDLNGVKTYTTDTNGQVKVSTAGLAPKTYMANITFKGNTNYTGFSVDVKVTILKATPKIAAKKKTYKAKAKTKKFTITLKDSAGKPIKNAKVRLIVKKVVKKSKKKGKSNKEPKSDKKKNFAKTNSKGKATFNVLKNKKGKYNAKVKFYGDQYYSKATKTVKITIK